MSYTITKHTILGSTRTLEITVDAVTPAAVERFQWDAAIPVAVVKAETKALLDLKYGPAAQPVGQSGVGTAL